MSVKQVIYILLLASFSFHARASIPSIKKVMVVVFENTSFQEAMAQPEFSWLAQNGALMTNYFGITHPSQPNYLAMVSGTTSSVSHDKNVDLNLRHIGDLIDGVQKSWKIYAEKYPGNCFTGKSSSSYFRKHNPFISFLNIQNDNKRCLKNLAEASAMDTDVQSGNLPNYSLYVPDINNDGHDTSPEFADKYLANRFGALLRDPKFMKDLLFVVTFDEDDRSGNNQIYTVLFGDSVIPGSTNSDRQDHYSLLRTIEDVLGVGNLGQNDAKATPIAGIWK
jgi:phospholipase C